MGMKSVKTLSMYLPQYYQNADNDEWWGEGFTDWTAVRAARPVFDGHRQPKSPRNGNYYNLLEKSVMEWQAGLMKKYGIDGQCMYHYYFQDGRKVLEKPAENLLEWKDIDMPFCFCWANERWIRTWQFDPWTDKFRKGEIKEQVLLEQKYGGVCEWEKHFQYLLPFFKDERYIKIDNAPVFMILMPRDIYCLEEMISYWKSRAKQSNFRDMYVIVSDDMPYKGVDALLRHSPHSFYERHRDMKKGGIFTFEYDKMWDRIIEEPPHINCKTYFEGVVNCDDTPRRGGKGTVMNGFSINAFYEGMVRLYRKSLMLGNEFVFINAWNEWGEGMYLEPDEEYGYQALEAVKRAQEDACVAQLNDNHSVWEYREGDFRNQLAKAEQNSRKYQRFYKCFNKWIENLEGGRHISDYLSQKGITSAAIYGYGLVGRNLLKELEVGAVEIRYLIDRNFNTGNGRLQIISPEDELEKVDAIIVTPFLEYAGIETKLRQKTEAKILSLEDIIYDM